jgi:Flp pilus assembly protein TadG
MKGAVVKKLRSERGQSAVEFTMLFPFILVLILIIIEFGFALHTNMRVTSSAREAARFAAVANLPSTTCVGGSVEGRAIATSGDLLTCSDVTVGYVEQNAVAGYSRGDAVVVRIRHDYAPITPLGDLMSAFSFGTFPTTFAMEACADVRLEGAPVDQSVLPAGAGDCG